MPPYQTLVQEFEITKRCERCDVLLSSSVLDTKQYAVLLKKNKCRKKYQKYHCLHCATKSYINRIFGIEKKEITKEDIDDFVNFMKTKEYD